MIKRTSRTLWHEVEGDTCNTICGAGFNALASLMYERSLSLERATLFHKTEPSVTRNTGMMGSRCPIPSFSVFQFGNGVAQAAL